MNLEQLMEHFFVLYGRRNSIFLPGLLERIDFLNIAIGDLQEAVRKEAGQPCLEVALARLVSRVFCIAEHFHSLPLVEALLRKYPVNKCSYCQKMPCGCLEKRADPCLVQEPSQKQQHWDLAAWCRHFYAIYGLRNSRQGFENLLNRLFKEVCELLSLRLGVQGRKESLLEIEMAFALELADALAWVIAIANFLEVDLERAVLIRFVDSNCWNCYEKPCICTSFNMEPVHWDQVAI